MSRRGRRFLACGRVSRILSRVIRCLTLVAAVGAVLTVPLTVTVLLLTVTDILHVPVTVVGAAGTVTVAAVVVAFTTVILPGRVVATAATGRGGAAATAGGGVAPAGAVTTRVEAPRSGRRRAGPLQLRQRCSMQVRGSGGTYLDLQQVITTDALVVHLVIGIISITARLILNECEAMTLLVSSQVHPWELFEGRLTDGWRPNAEQGCHSEQDDHTFGWMLDWLFFVVSRRDEKQNEVDGPTAPGVERGLSTGGHGAGSLDRLDS